MAFVDSIFPLELMERKMHELVNLRQGGMSVKEYRLKFTLLSKHDLTMVEDSRAKMNKFIMGISKLVVNECRSAMLIPIIEISRLMIHDELIEEKKLTQVCRELRKTRIEDGSSSKSRLEVTDKPRFKKRFYK